MMSAKSEALLLWKEQLWSTYVRLESKSEAAGFYGSVQEFFPHRHSLSLVDSTAQLTERTRRHIRTDQQEVVLVAFQLSGCGRVTQDEREAWTVPGEFVFYESIRPYSLGFDGPFRQLVLRIDRERMISTMPCIGNLTARTFDARRGAGAVALDFLQSLAARGSQINEGSVSPMERTAFDLIATGVLSSTGDLSPRRVLFERLRDRLIERVRDPSFNQTEMAVLAGISTRSLRRLCAENGISPVGLILRTRLQGVRDSLALDGNKRRSVTEIALSWGFNDISHFNRAFRTTYGMTPGQMRHSHQ
ncbi:AraC family transcriptional regulator [Agrobacterium deltaense]|uniref:AraC-like ligand-binding domain-containing protein n=1 Tax=Agrobacterium TaxID=357 RepID=UPI0007459BBB|nr:MULTISPECIES: helix-turn-helix domain-containing protein [Agrobacterium]KVK54181.1 AraC family transcriptional regulator [Agrobacterium sp. D14]RKF41869.1 AraC family transcriptional regulator [Agrobacterium deltaense]